MANLEDGAGSFAELEALVSSAGDYVRASDDLRPRVLESARWARGERRAQQQIGRVAIAALLIAVFLGSGAQYVELSLRRPGAEPAARLISQTPPQATFSDASWEMVESFTNLRRRQAELLNLEL